MCRTLFNVFFNLSYICMLFIKMFTYVLLLDLTLSYHYLLNPGFMCGDVWGLCGDLGGLCEDVGGLCGDLGGMRGDLIANTMYFENVTVVF